ncbi:MAG: hypothetical protein WBY44_02540 [Bryobacteraceae bacterium]
MTRQIRRRCFCFTLLAAATMLSTCVLDAQQLSDGTIYAGESGATGFNGDGGKATAAELFSPVGVAFDSKGNLYIADSLNNRIRQVAAGTGIITSFAGTGRMVPLTTETPAMAAQPPAPI